MKKCYCFAFVFGDYCDQDFCSCLKSSKATRKEYLHVCSHMQQTSEGISSQMKCSQGFEQEVWKKKHSWALIYGQFSQHPPELGDSLSAQTASPLSSLHPSG